MMLETPLPVPGDFAVDPETGFLPFEPPLRRLPDAYYTPWEAIMADLQPLLFAGRLRDAVDGMPVLTTERLHGEREWQRAYVCLVFMQHSYVWGGDHPAQVSDPDACVSLPFGEVAPSPEYFPWVSTPLGRLPPTVRPPHDRTDRHRASPRL